MTVYEVTVSLFEYKKDGLGQAPFLSASYLIEADYNREAEEHAKNLFTGKYDVKAEAVVLPLSKISKEINKLTVYQVTVSLSGVDVVAQYNPFLSASYLIEAEYSYEAVVHAKKLFTISKYDVKAETVVLPVLRIPKELKDAALAQDLGE